MSSEKQYAPTRKRLERARREGQTARSAMAGKAVAVAAIFTLGFRLLPDCWVELGLLLEYCSNCLEPDLKKCLARGRRWVQVVSGSLLCMGAAAALIVEFCQVGVRFEISLVQPRVSRLSVLSGLRRICSGIRDSWVQLFFAALISCTGAILVTQHLPEAVTAILAGARGFSFLVFLIVVLAGTVLAYAGVDLCLKRKRFRTDQSMSSQDMRDELKEAEGDPQVRRMRQVRHEEIALTELVARVKRARVIVVERG